MLGSRRLAADGGVAERRRPRSCLLPPAADVEEKEANPPWKVQEPDPLRHKGPVVQVRHTAWGRSRCWTCGVVTVRAGAAAGLPRYPAINPTLLVHTPTPRPKRNPITHPTTTATATTTTTTAAAAAAAAVAAATTAYTHNPVAPPPHPPRRRSWRRCLAATAAAGRCSRG